MKKFFEETMKKLKDVKVKEAFAKMGAAISKTGKSLMKSFMETKLEVLIRIGIVAGVSIATVIIIFKILKEKKKTWTDDENKNATDKALEINYAECKNHNQLHPAMKKVQKNLKKDIKPRKKKHQKLTDMPEFLYVKDYAERARQRRNEYAANFDVLTELDIFTREMQELERQRKIKKMSGRRYTDNQSLRRIWP